MNFLLTAIALLAARRLDLATGGFAPLATLDAAAGGTLDDTARHLAGLGHWAQRLWLQQGNLHVYLLYIFIACAVLLEWSVFAGRAGAGP